jgi:NlpC/P60 family putative phage cell wall peptidase
VIVERAREWLGTPYCHQQSVKGIGCDCLGFLRGVYEEVTGLPARQPPPYSPSWDEVGRQELMLAAANEHLIRTDTIVPGCVLVFRMKRGAVAKHCGIATSENAMIHAHSSRGVVEEPLAPYWLRRIAGIYLFPKVN